MSDEPLMTDQVTISYNEYLELSKGKDGAYWERNQLVSTLSKIFPSYLAKHPKEDEKWDDDWRNIVVVNIPKQTERTDLVFHTDGKERGYLSKEYYQLTWHIHDYDLPMFDHLSLDEGHYWDGHTTEAKYHALRTLQAERTHHD